MAPASWGDVIRDDLEWFADPAQCAISDAAVSVADNTITTIGATGTEIYDTDNMHSNVSNRSRITATTAGRYEASATGQFAANNTGHRLLRFIVNNTTAYDVLQSAAAPTVATNLSGIRSIVMAATDYGEVQVRQASGGALNFTLQEFRLKWESR